MDSTVLNRWASVVSATQAIASLTQLKKLNPDLKDNELTQIDSAISFCTQVFESCETFHEFQIKQSLPCEETMNG